MINTNRNSSVYEISPNTYLKSKPLVLDVCYFVKGLYFMFELKVCLKFHVNSRSVLSTTVHSLPLNQEVRIILITSL